MRTVGDLRALRACIRAWKQEGHRVGFVPTMGNLHAGHFSLVDLARRQADRVVASVFVNPTQFGPSEDFARYPRTLAEDSVGLVEHNCDLLFAPSVEVMYPFGPEQAMRIHVPGVGDTLEGAHRPGHFDGVATIVAKLFAMVEPDVAVFGQKDWQQLLVVRRLARELAFPLEIVAGPTVRDDDGLALSSRNRYLDVHQRARAPELHATLEWMRESFVDGHVLAAIEGAAVRRLERAGFNPDYAVVRRAEDLGVPAEGERSGLLALVAAKLGNTRLIDNLAFD
ncbi:MAG: pantoate--beta-alanine ligase [Xanthomonadaceae bacterium]|nr:pantoate--beta-alanine ligase [Xanthomonadaceae bacterium]MBU6477788.1 pantoate--beta-alanine ligase [Xanthomonadaceae bacterium]